MFLVVRKGFGGDVILARVVGKALEKLDSHNLNTAASMAPVYERVLFKRWIKSDNEPKSTYRKIFDVEDASAGRLDNGFVTRYRKY
ncbi:hypothetical protein PC116_g7567 [Phytophthora cactorum]|uniref:Uncharacterized protein n=1 Tax=Phytophthora cactorum TaxID=29920 RepID=A0A8T1EIP3_9STRA|nr:hypothetical protein PC117_g1164 [Phytophthora cactorum]KAG3185324.1 hypothetical protein C6341_g4525 [Phytophthora cactorum]KAG4244589.1 hypothetical protein PC116_g7567 [Phytophthora cactorum]